MDKDKKKYLRSLLFRHLDGISICGPISALNRSGITKYIQNHPIFTLKELLSQFKSNVGYLNVTLRLLTSQGWLNQNIIKDGVNIHYKLTEKGQKCFQLSHYYDPFSDFIPNLINIEKYLFDSKSQSVKEEFRSLLDLLESFSTQYSKTYSPEWEIGRHLEGLLIGPILVTLGMSEYFLVNINIDQAIDKNTIGNNKSTLWLIIDFFLYLGWIEINDNEIRFTKEGIFFMRRASAYGVTVSYLPTFQKVPELLFGNPNVLWQSKTDGQESHVNRRMNVWGSGGAHALYFSKIDEIIVEIFNQPIIDQPVGIADMGCGDGTLLKHLYQVVKEKTIRGNNLDTYPLNVIGADFNKAARLASTITLKEAGIPYSIINGDISNPDEYARILFDKHGLKLQEMLNVRSFLDHNRIYSPPKNNPDHKLCNSTGAFAFRGRWIPNKELKQNLVEHFSAWTKYVSRYGLLMLELHTISPNLTYKHLGRTVATAYDGTHGFSDQYIIEVDIMLEAAKEAGLNPVAEYEVRFPNDEITTISINLFRSNN